jgi:predicted lysophospholipase L1 biosynthesis ABC-type transport system permease subunit
MLERRLAWAGAAVAAALAAFGFAVTSATLALSHYLGFLAAISIMTAVLAACAAGGFWFALRKPVSEEGEREPLALALARDMIRRQPLSAVALFGALGFAVARRPRAAAEIGRGFAKLMLG